MSSLSFEVDIRDKDPNQNAHRIARFREGWRKAATETFSDETLKTLTWENLGYRLGKLFGDTPPEQVDELYAWCVRQQSSGKSDYQDNPQRSELSGD